MLRQKDYIKKHIDLILIRRMKIYFFIAIFMIAIMIYEIIATWFNPLIALSIFLLGILVWFFISRMFKIFWNKKEQVISSRIDVIWWIILCIYIYFSFSRYYLIGLFVQSPLVFVVTFSSIAWVMLGRFLAMRRSIIQILRKQEII